MRPTSSLRPAKSTTNRLCNASCSALGQLFETCRSPLGIDVDDLSASEANARTCAIRLEPSGVDEEDASLNLTLSFTVRRAQVLAQ